jgi:malonyl-CoA O-methyltransferase
MEEAGFQDVVHTEEEMRQYFPTPKDFLMSVKKIGANNTGCDSRAPVSRQLLFTMMGCYEQAFQEHGHIHATYHTIYGIGRKP